MSDRNIAQLGDNARNERDRPYRRKQRLLKWRESFFDPKRDYESDRRPEQDHVVVEAVWRRQQCSAWKRGILQPGVCRRAPKPRDCGKRRSTDEALERICLG